MFRWFLVIIGGWLYLMLPTPSQADAAPIPRTLFVLYDAYTETIPRYTIVHRTLEMPLNWLGYHLEYHEHNDPLPAWRNDVAGVVLWLSPGIPVANQTAYLDWLDEGIEQQKKLLVMGNPGFDPKLRSTSEGSERVNAILSHIGMRDNGGWVGITYNSTLADKNPNMVEFEHRYGSILPGYHTVTALPGAAVHLSIHDTDEENNPLLSHLVTTHANGGYIAEGYGLYYELDDDGQTVLAQRWLVNPFAFLNAALGAGDQPRPDVTTLNGRRIFYSHLDGDGWNNYTEIREYQKKKTISAEVLLDEVYRPYQQLPFTIAPIVSELDPACHGRAESADIARTIFTLPNVEPASHTYSHPLLWRFFKHDDPSAEIRFLNRYPDPPTATTSIFDAARGWLTPNEHLNEQWQPLVESYNEERPLTEIDRQVDEYFKIPRSYACAPFNLHKEVVGSVEYLQALAPPEKEISLYQWSGDTTPAESALREVRKAGLLNINGGDSRFDPDYPSYSYVAPLGLKVGAERQIYSSNSNENTYTALWSERFFGFRNLVSTVRNTETPRRISPFNIYYHTYSGEKRASLEALKQNLDYALTQPLIPLFTSQYARIARDYFLTEITPLDDGRWRIDNRGALQTIRFDRATLRTIDWSRSEGVIGQRHYQGSLYIFLNPSHDTPIIALQPNNTLTYPIMAPRPYILESRWIIENIQHRPDGLTMQVRGFGKGRIQLYWPYGENVTFQLLKDSQRLQTRQVTARGNDVLTLVIDQDTSSALTVQLQQTD